MTGRVPSAETTNTDSTKLPKSGAAIGGLGIALLGLALAKGAGHHSAAPNAGDTHGAQTGHSASAPTAPGHTYKATKPKAPAASHQQPVVPVKGPNILSWPQKPVSQYASNELIQLTAQNPRETLMFPLGKSSVSVTVEAPDSPAASMNVSISDPNHDGKNTVTINANGKLLQLGQETETPVPGTDIEVVTSGSSAEALGLEIAH